MTSNESDRIAPIVVRDPAIPLTHCSASLRLGAALDPEGKEGATRLLLRLLRRASANMSAEQIDEDIDRFGGSLGIDVSRSVAGLHGAVIARSRDEFHRLLAQILTEPRFDEEELGRIKQESQAEWVESLDDDSALARRFFAREIFQGHPYGRLAGGTPASLERITIEDMRDLYPQLLGRKQLRFAFAGDVDEQICSRVVDDILARLPDTEPSVDSCESPQGPRGRQLLFVSKPERSQTQIMIGGLGTHPRDEDHTALYVGHTIFGGTFSSRLSQEVRGKRGWSYGAYSNLPFDRKRHAFSLWTFPQASDAGACIELELQLLENFIEHGVTQEELDAAKLYLENSHAFTLDTAAKRAALALDIDLYDLPHDYFDRHVDRVRALSVTDVNAAIRLRLSAENLSIVVVGTEDAIFRDVEQAIPRLDGSRIVAFDSPE